VPRPAREQHTTSLIERLELRQSTKTICKSTSVVDDASMSNRLNIPAYTRFGKLTVLDLPLKLVKYQGWFYWCECDCGKRKQIYGSRLISGRTKSCGCGKWRTHGMSKTYLYRRWMNMRGRCQDPEHHQYKNYGARGIRVCKRWEDFAKFFQDMGHPPTLKHTLDRKNNDGPYSPSNCRWATEKEQKNNTRRSRYSTFNGLTLTTSQWADRIGVPRKFLNLRLFKGWSIERAITEPRHDEKIRHRSKVVS